MVRQPTEAEQKATKRWNDALEYLKGAGIAENDIKTIGYNLNPKYDYSRTNLPCSPTYCPPQGTPVLVGYTMTLTAQVKIRNLDKAGEILSGVSRLGVQNVNGVDFTLNFQNELQAEARRQAIQNAKGQGSKS
jgi:uncharacterized protein YggE